MIKLANNLTNLVLKQAGDPRVGFSDAQVKCTPGIGCKRLLSKAELAEVAAAEANMLPNLFAQQGDPVTSLVSSPGWAGIGHGILGAGLGGGAGYLGANMTNNNSALGSGIGAAAGGLLGLIYGAVNRTRTNNDIMDLMEDLPVGADIGDIETFHDPKIRAQIARDFQRQMLRRGLNRSYQ